MIEMFEKLAQLQARRLDAVLATVVSTSSAAPRTQGAQLLLSPHGTECGTIGGGALEKEAAALGAQLLFCQESRLFRHSPPRLDGSVCGGEVSVWLQFISWNDALWGSIASQVSARRRAGQGGALVLSLDGGATALLDESGAILCGTAPADTTSVFTLPLIQQTRAVIYGAGHCAQALAPLLTNVGFRVVVYDDRPELAQAALFPSASQILCAPFVRALDLLPLSPEDYIIAMSSTHGSDLCILRQALRTPHAYVGMIGGAPKRSFIFQKLQAEGVSPELLEQVHTPIGLDILAETPEEIAVSIAAEMIRIRAQRRMHQKGAVAR